MQVAQAVCYFKPFTETRVWSEQTGQYLVSAGAECVAPTGKRTFIRQHLNRASNCPDLQQKQDTGFRLQMNGHLKMCKNAKASTGLEVCQITETNSSKGFVLAHQQLKLTLVDNQILN